MELVQTLRHGDIAQLHLARAPVNALNPDLCEALRAACDAAITQGAQGLILSGGPSVFSAGLDVPHLMALGGDRDALTGAWESFFAAARALAASPVPVAAAMAGHAPAGGCVLALCCDYRVMAVSSDPAKPFRIGLNETQVGLIAPEGIQQLMSRVVGPHRAERLLVAGELLTTDQALNIGLIDEAVDGDEVIDTARQWLQAMLTLPREAMLATRAIARADIRQALQPERIRLPHFVDAWYSDGTQAALNAVLARLGKK